MKHLIEILLKILMTALVAMGLVTPAEQAVLPETWSIIEQAELPETETIVEQADMSAEDAADDQPQTSLPQVGEIIEGFEVLEIRDFPLVNAAIVLFEHQATGAKLTYVANEDTNRAFQPLVPRRGDA